MSGNAVFFLVLDINQFAGAEHFLREVSGLANNIKTCPKAEGAGEILVPGEPERRSCAQRRQSGIPLDDGTWKQLSALAEKLKVALPS
jgi:LDH2 family malate/lactate/ureidoglycolate dehydrogenase